MALRTQDQGGGNVAVGLEALSLSVSGEQNVAVGTYALRDSVGSYNVALGGLTGASKVSGSYNTYIGYGVADDVNNIESNTVRIGDDGFVTRAFVAGVRGFTTGVANAVTVMIDSNGQLGTVSSSGRLKEDIQDMGSVSAGLMKLRPVTFRYTQAYADGSKPIDYGLIAEEVEAVYPDLVTHTAAGEVETVQYHKINAMLLNEVQKQRRELEVQRLALERLAARLAALEADRK
jgi:hypothetical protein